MQFVVFMELAGTLVLPAAISFTLYLIIISIIPGHANTTIPLVLLAIILGLPGLLIVITSRKIAYLGWMLIYLLSLPIWNFVLPAYAFWHFDDFSWGQTRQVSGGEKKGNYGDKEGQFDSSHIVMKRWAEFERDRRWKTGTQSRESTFEPYGRSGSPKRYSLASTMDSYPQLPQIPQGQLYDGDYNGSPRMLGLPRRPGSASPSSNNSPSRRSVDMPYVMPSQSSSNQRLIPSPSESDLPDGDQTTSHSSVASDAQNPQAVLMTPSALESHMARTSGLGGPSSVLRQGTMSREYPGETPNPYRYSQPQSAGYGEAFPPAPSIATTSTAVTSSADEDDAPLPTRTRGVSLVDPGPIPSADGVRRVARQSTRRSTQQLSPPPQSPLSAQPAQGIPPSNPSTSSRLSRSSNSSAGLPPGAAPPMPQQYRYS